MADPKDVGNDQQVDAAGNLQVGVVGDLRLQNGNLGAKATDKINFAVNLDANKEVVAVTPFDPTNLNSYTSTQTTPVFDSQGKQHSLTQYFVKTGDNTWETHYYVGNTAVGGPEPMTFSTWPWTTGLGRNPATGEAIQIKAKKVVKFRVAKAAKDAILGSK